MPTQEVDKRQSAREVLDILEEIAMLLKTNLNRTQLSYCVSLLESGVHPDSLVSIIMDIREEYGQELSVVDSEE